jgi:FADH2 O2-dependent halogenase
MDSRTSTSGSSVAVRRAALERELFPRPHVGESLVPAANRVLGELGLMPAMEERQFPKKFGAVWTTTTHTESHEIDWDGLDSARDAIRFDERAQPGVDKGYTYHVDRGQFDLMLLQNANERGTAVYEGVAVQGVDFSEPLPKIKFQFGRRQLDARVRMVVDASGRRTLLGNQLKLKVMDPVFDQYAIHTWFDGFDRALLAKKPDQLDYIYIHFLPVSNTWVWQIPITNTITSVGVVTQKKHFSKTRDAREKFFWDCLETYPALYAGVKAAKQMRPFKDEGDYSYAMRQIAGDRYVLLGDAGRFVDPIFSSGVSIAMNSARFASADILKAHETGDFSHGAFETFEATLRRGTRNWYNFIAVYYRLNVLFTYFIRDPRYRLDVLKLLQGDVYDEQEPQVLSEMREMVAGVQASKRHPWHKLLNDLTGEEFRPVF